jgi:hypothetical protein
VGSCARLVLLSSFLHRVGAAAALRGNALKLRMRARESGYVNTRDLIRDSKKNSVSNVRS